MQKANKRIKKFQYRPNNIIISSISLLLKRFLIQSSLTVLYTIIIKVH